MVKENGPIPIWTCEVCKNQVKGDPKERICPNCGAPLKHVQLTFHGTIKISDSLNLFISFWARNWIVTILSIVGAICGFFACFLLTWYYGVIVWAALTIIGIILNRQPKKIRKTKKLK